jgi:hypothetical protein
MILLISTSQVAGITDMSHQVQPQSSKSLPLTTIWIWLQILNPKSLPLSIENALKFPCWPAVSKDQHPAKYLKQFLMSRSKRELLLLLLLLLLQKLLILFISSSFQLCTSSSPESKSIIFADFFCSQLLDLIFLSFLSELALLLGTCVWQQQMEKACRDN